MDSITRDGLPDRLRALAEDEIAGRKPVLSPGNSHDLLTAADEIEHLSLTDEEREAIEWASRTLCIGWHDLYSGDKQRTRDAAATLRVLLDRHDRLGSV